MSIILMIHLTRIQIVETFQRSMSNGHTEYKMRNGD